MRLILHVSYDKFFKLIDWLQTRKILGSLELLYSTLFHSQSIDLKYLSYDTCNISLCLRNSVNIYIGRIHIILLLLFSSSSCSRSFHIARSFNLSQFLSKHLFRLSHLCNCIIANTRLESIFKDHYP